MIVPVALGVGLYALATQPRVQRHELRVGTTGSSTEPCSETTLSAEEIYDRLRAGTQYAAINDARTEIQQLAGKYATRLSDIRELASRMEAGWRGEAAHGAVRYSRPAADVLESSGERLDASARVHGPLDRQAEAYSTVMATVVKVPAKPESGVFGMYNPFDIDTEQAVRDYNNAASRNITAYAEYYTASGVNGRAMPQQFPVPPSGSAPTVVVVPARGDAGTGPRSTYVPVPTVAGGGASHGTGSSNALGPPAGGGSGTTSPVYGAPSGTAPQSQPADVGRPVPAGPAPGGATTPAGPGGGGASGGALGGLFSRPGEGVGAGRPGGGGHPGGSRGAVESGPRTHGNAEPSGRGGAGGVERGGIPGTGAPGARRGKDAEEDKEHRTKYLESENLGKQWGTTEPVAPPVIGERR